MSKRKNSREKGAKGERHAAKYLTDLGFNAERCARNGVAGGDDLIVHDLPRVHIEVKRDEALRDDNGLMVTYMAQAVDAAGDREPMVLWRTNNRKWRLTYLCPAMKCHVTATGDERIKTVLLKLNDARRGAEDA